MFYSQYVLAKKGPLGKIWLAAHMGEKKVPKVQVVATNIPESIAHIENPTVPMALRMSGHLMLGVVRIFSRKVTYLLSDCSEAMVKIKDAFRGPGGVDMAPGAATRRYDDITNPEHFDEMDLDSHFVPAQMSFAIGDEMEGISIPDDVADNMMNDGGFGLDAGEGGFGAEESGFGHDENFEVFFEKADQPPEKRRRTTEPTAAQGDEEQAEDDEALPEIERERSAAEPRDDAMQPESELEANAAFEQDFGGEPAAFDEFGAVEDPLAGSMDEVIIDGPASKAKSRRSSVGASEAEAPQSQQEAGAAKPSRKPSNKRKAAMTFDNTIQISNGEYKRMLQDTSAITRDLVAERTKRQRKAPSDLDLFSGAPSLSVLPPEALELDCFQPGNLNVFGRRQRATKAAAQPADAEPDAEGVEDEQAAQPIAEEEMGGDFGMEMGDGMEAQPFGEEPLGEEEPPLDEEPLPSVPDTFEGGSQALPNVDGNEVGKGGRGGGASQIGAADSVWSARTQKMHAMLDRAFAESDGMALSFDAMVAKSKGKEKRRVVAGCFQELLFLSTHGLLELQQQQPYANIIISKAEGFDAVDVVA